MRMSWQNSRTMDRHVGSIVKKQPAAIAMQRRILAVSAVALLVGNWRLAGSVPTRKTFWQFCWRGGAILGAAWLAYNDVQRLPTWLLLILPVLLIVLIRWSKLLIWIIPGLLVWAAPLRRILARRARRAQRSAPNECYCVREDR